MSLINYIWVAPAAAAAAKSSYTDGSLWGVALVFRMCRFVRVIGTIELVRKLFWSIRQSAGMLLRLMGIFFALLFSMAVVGLQFYSGVLDPNNPSLPALVGLPFCRHL